MNRHPLLVARAPVQVTFLVCCASSLGCSGTPAVVPVKPASSAKVVSSQAAPTPLPTPTAALAPAATSPTVAECTPADPADACKRACDAGRIASCLRYGRLRLSPRPGPYDPKEAGAAFQKACEAGDATACGELGMLYKGDALERDDPRAAALFRKACDAGLASGCGRLAILRIEGEPEVEATTEADVAATFALLDQACQSGHANSCSFRGGLYFLGIHHVEKDIPKARALAEKGCSMGDFRGCKLAGLAWALNWGGVPADGARALAYQVRTFEMVQKECGLTGHYCSEFADYYATGHGVVKDQAKALSVLQDACWRRTEDPIACNDLGLEYETGKIVQQDFAKAIDLFEIGCKANVSRSCFELNRLYKFGQGVAKDPVKAFTFIERSCALGDEDGCDIMGTKYQEGEGVERSLEKGLAARRKACGWRSARACRMLGQWLVWKDGVEVPAGEGVREAATHLARACEIEGGKGCFSWALLHDRGWGVPKDAARAKALAKRACDDKAHEACAWLRDPRLVPSWFKEREARDAKRSP